MESDAGALKMGGSELPVGGLVSARLMKNVLLICKFLM